MPIHTHGMVALSTRMYVNRLEPRQRRALAKIQRALTANPLEHLKALNNGHLSRYELLLQGYQAYALKHPDQDPPQRMLGIENAWRRRAELAALLEERIASGADKSRASSTKLRQSKRHLRVVGPDERYPRPNWGAISPSSAASNVRDRQSGSGARVVGGGV